jgi:chromosome transmission fidelity protein 1
LSWLRSYKKRQYENEITTAKEGLKDEPDWIVEQMLRRKREEIVRRWQDREERLAKVRAKEKESEERGSKRRRVGEAAAKTKGKDVDEDTEFLLDDWEGDDANTDDPMSMFSKETRALMEKAGLGTWRKPEEDEPEDPDEIKVRDSPGMG